MTTIFDAIPGCGLSDATAEKAEYTKGRLNNNPVSFLMADASEGLSAEARSLLAAVKRVSEVSATKSLSELEPLIESALLLSPRTPEELGEDLLAVCDLLSLQVSPMAPVAACMHELIAITITLGIA